MVVKRIFILTIVFLLNNWAQVLIVNEAITHFNNCLLTGFGSSVLKLEMGAPSVYLNNSVSVSNAINNNSSNILNNISNGSLNLANCLVHPNPRTAKHITGSISMIMVETSG